MRPSELHALDTIRGVEDVDVCSMTRPTVQDCSNYASGSRLEEGVDSVLFVVRQWARTAAQGIWGFVSSVCCRTSWRHDRCRASFIATRTTAGCGSFLASSSRRESNFCSDQSKSGSIIRLRIAPGGSDLGRSRRRRAERDQVVYWIGHGLVKILDQDGGPRRYLPSGRDCRYGGRRRCTRPHSLAEIRIAGSSAMRRSVPCSRERTHVPSAPFSGRVFRRARAASRRASEIVCFFASLAMDLSG